MALSTQGTFFWTFLDQAITMIERERLQRETVQIELLRRTDELRSALLSSVSHDLRTPLSSIKAAASSLLQDDVEVPVAARRTDLLLISQKARNFDALNFYVGDNSRYHHLKRPIRFGVEALDRVVPPFAPRDDNNIGARHGGSLIIHYTTFDGCSLTNGGSGGVLNAQSLN